jgi:hypothetical protein
VQEQAPTESNTTGKQFITELDPAEEPVVPFGVMGPYKTGIWVLVKDSIPIKYMYRRQPGSEWAVPSSLKNLCWEKLKDLFDFPDGFDEEVVKDRIFFIMGNSFKYFRYYLNTQYVRKGIEPEWSEYPYQQEYWSDFVSGMNLMRM